MAEELRGKFPLGYAIFSAASKGQEIVPLRDESGLPIQVDWNTGAMVIDDRRIYLTVPDFLDSKKGVTFQGTKITLMRKVGSRGSAFSTGGPKSVGYRLYAEIIAVQPGVVVAVLGMMLWDPKMELLSSPQSPP